jgi:hypothetical protein
MVAGTVDTGKWHPTPTPLQQYKIEILKRNFETKCSGKSRVKLYTNQVLFQNCTKKSKENLRI